MRFTMRDGKITLGYGVVTQTNEDVDMEALRVERKAVKKAKAAERAEQEQQQY